jgi:hypothetical protein
LVARRINGIFLSDFERGDRAGPVSPCLHARAGGLGLQAKRVALVARAFRPIR